MELKDLIYEKEGHIAYIYINRPQALNSFTLDTLEEFYWIQDQILADMDIRVVVLAAKGKIFSAGIDVSVLKSGNPQYAVRYIQKLQEYYNRWEKMPQPIIAAVHSTCIGGSIENILACDIRISNQSATYSLPEINFGFSPDMGATQRLTRAVGAGQAKRLIMTGDFISSEEALRIGLVDFVVPDEELMEFTAKLARKIANKPPLAIGVAKKAINLAQDTSLSVGLQFEQLGSSFLFCTEDFQEGPKAFFEKRKPNFQGK
ncbi:MAG: enoyl-CoA hydratase/isomerase family protein [Syntrophomonadaceae bacterium]|nr:enoyl-CoA hydratase/isomerase family protein [Syntrophomonadaceae bacterium]